MMRHVCVDNVGKGEQEKIAKTQPEAVLHLAVIPGE